MSYSPGALPSADEGYYWWVDPQTGEYFQLPNASDPPAGSVPVGGPDVPSRETDEDGTVTVGPPVGTGPTPEQIAAAERGTNFEGRSFGAAEEANWISSALNNGVPQGWIDSFLARNPHDANRIYEQWLDEQTANGAEIRNQGTTGGTGTGGGGQRNAFDPPPNALGWMPRLDLPTWEPPPAYEAPDPFAYGEFSHPDYVAPEPYVPGTFTAPTIEEARQEPGFQFALDEGRRQMEASAAAKGIGRTGGTVKRLIGYGQEMADTNYGNVYNRNLGTFNVNENNRAGAYRTNADVGFGAWEGNRNNASNIFNTNYGVARDVWDRNRDAGRDVWDRNFLSAQTGHTARTNELIGEFAPIQQEAVVSHQQDFAAWLAKMGIAQNIFNEGSD